MKKSTIKFLSIFLAISVLICTLNVSVFASDDVEDSIEKVYCEATLDDDFTDNEILIVVTPENNFREYTVNDFSAIGCIEIEDLTIEPKEGELCRIFHLTLSVHSKKNVLNSIKILEERNDIYSAEPNYIAIFNEIPNDAGYANNSQWIDQIDLPEAWNITTGSSSVRVGVIDTGIDASHPDLVNRVNEPLSKNFVNDSQSATANLVSDHGTHVAGIIGAQGDNDIGMAGVCWNVELVSLRVDYISSVNNTVTTNLSAVVDAIKYAARDDVDIDILNYSAGTPTFSNNIESIAIQIQNFDGLFVCSLGNNNINRDEFPYYPSDYKFNNLISVGASSLDDRKASFSDYGKTKADIFAPGVDIYSTVLNSGYATHYGTSMATPIVTGVAALLLSENSNLTAQELKSIILHSVDIIYDSEGNSVFGELCASGGRLNAYNALTLTNISHSYYYVEGNEGTHTCVCLICGYEKQENHTWKYSSSNLRNHTVSCKYCTFDYTESHNFNLLTGICQSCGYNSNNLGTLNRLLGLL